MGRRRVPPRRRRRTVASCRFRGSTAQSRRPEVHRGDGGGRRRASRRADRAAGSRGGGVDARRRRDVRRRRTRGSHGDRVGGVRARAARAPTVAPFGALGPDAAAEWNAVAGALLGWCGCEALADRFASSRDEDESRSKRVDARDDDESGDEDDWSYLLATSSRETRLATSRYPALRSSPSETSTSPSSDEPTPRSRGVPSLDDANLARAFALLDATHATYEASKLDALRRPTLSRLGRLCVALATACRGTGTDSGRRANVAATAAGYLDRHARDGGGVFAADVSNASSNASHAVDQLRAVAAAAPARHAAFAKTARIADAANAAPDIVSALEDILAGTDFETANARVPSLVRAASEGHDRSGRPLDRARVGSTCAWAADVVSFARAAASSSAAAAGDSRAARDAAAALTAAMTTAGFGLAELARVPAGVAVPIRDALRRCRRDPPEGWPAAACALVGRDDLAAAAADAAGDARRRRRFTHARGSRRIPRRRRGRRRGWREWAWRGNRRRGDDADAGRRRRRRRRGRRRVGRRRRVRRRRSRRDGARRVVRRAASVRARSAPPRGSRVTRERDARPDLRRRRRRRRGGRGRRPGGCRGATGASVVSRASDRGVIRGTRRVHARHGPRAAHGGAASADVDVRGVSPRAAQRDGKTRSCRRLRGE